MVVVALVVPDGVALAGEELVGRGCQRDGQGLFLFLFGIVFRDNNNLKRTRTAPVDRCASMTQRAVT